MPDPAELRGPSGQPIEGNASPPKRGFFRRHRRAKWVLPAVVAAITAGGYLVWNYYSVRVSTDDAQINGHLIPISARVGGYIAQVCIDENQVVQAGTVLFQIDPTDYKVALARARADLASAQAAVESATTSVPITTTTAGSRLSTAQASADVARAALTSAQDEVSAAQAQWKSAQAQQEQAEANDRKAAQDLKRYQFLVGKDEVPRQQYDTAAAAAQVFHAALDSAKARTTAAEQQVAVARGHLAQAKAGVEQSEAQVRAARTVPQQIAVSRASESSAKARVKQAQAMLQQAELNLQYTTVRAPVDGVIGKKSIETGMNVQPGQALLTLVPLKDIWVTANFKETQLRHMKPGQKVQISVDTYGRTFHGYVESIAAATGEKYSLLPPENATGNYVKVVQRIPVRLRFNRGQDPNHLLRPGMSVTVTVITG